MAYLKDLLFLSFFSCILTYTGFIFICLKPYPSFLCSFCLSPLFVFYVCWNVNFWGLQCWTNSSTLVELINVGNKNQESIKDVKTFAPYSWRFFHHMCLELHFQEPFLSLRMSSVLWEPLKWEGPEHTTLFLRHWDLCCTQQAHTEVQQMSLRLSVGRLYTATVLY